MSECKTERLRDYAFDELPASELPALKRHISECPDCAAELDQLRLTTAALRVLPDREPPQRIAFVSDKVFEPAPWRRWWAAFWGSAARLGFASAAMLSVAILVFALTRGPAQRPVTGVSAGSADVQVQIQAAVDKAVHESEARQSAKTEKLVEDFLNRQREDNKLLASAADYIQYQDHHLEAVAAEAYRQRSAAGGGQ